MRRRVSKARSALKFIEDNLQVRATSYDYSYIYNLEIKKKTKIIQVPVKEWIFVVPLDLKSYSILEAIDAVGWRVSLGTVNDNCCSKLTLYPSCFL